MTIIYLESSHLALPFFCNKQSFFEKLQYVLCIVCFYAYHFAPNTIETTDMRHPPSFHELLHLPFK